MAKRAWSHGDIVKLIDMYESRAMLCDCRSNECKNRDQKNAALNEIAKVFNCTNEVVLRKIHNFRNQSYKNRGRKKLAALVENKRVNGNTSMQ
ncbi:hypothetical protein PR048_005246 [Dryococelus australis]|uniref:MADF domain-containing protein n=1 Tax=Dryococelus australis TaxID=614101 RepID=A0ABQ9I7L5_9NEOP|nr:hypothetical protein PR048_005246 [Dryococelus australis]